MRALGDDVVEMETGESDARARLEEFERDLVVRVRDDPKRFAQVATAERALAEADSSAVDALLTEIARIAEACVAPPDAWHYTWRERSSARPPRDVAPQPAGGHDRSVFRAYSTYEFQDWPSWLRLQRILQTNGGSYGISGPRGAGKTWLMRRAIDEVARSGLGHWYPSPSEYDPMAFLASLSMTFATEVERSVATSATIRMRTLVLVASSLSVGAGVAILTRSRGSIASLHNLAVAAATTIVAAVVLSWLLRAIESGRPSPQSLLRHARRVRESARFTASQRESTELGAEPAGRLGLKGKLTRERELVERPATLSSLAHDSGRWLPRRHRCVGGS